MQKLDKLAISGWTLTKIDNDIQTKVQSASKPWEIKLPTEEVWNQMERQQVDQLLRNIEVIKEITEKESKDPDNDKDAVYNTEKANEPAVQQIIQIQRERTLNKISASIRYLNQS